MWRTRGLQCLVTEPWLRDSVADLATDGDLSGVDIQTKLYFDHFLGRSLGLLVYCALFHMEPTVWSGSRRLSAICHLPWDEVLASNLWVFFSLGLFCFAGEGDGESGPLA